MTIFVNAKDIIAVALLGSLVVIGLACWGIDSAQRWWRKRKQERADG